jgi:outer membrane protein OmpA-like peptidoglycan-associated protein
MPNYYIHECRSVEFDKEELPDPASQGKRTVTVEGKWVRITYQIKNAYSEGHPSTLQIHKNYANAVTRIGGSTYESGDRTYFKVAKGDEETWGYLYCNQKGKGIFLTVIEKEKMKQEVVADAAFLGEGIRSTGHVAVYGIYFDFNKAEVKPESEPALKEMAKLLQQDGQMKLYVVGHTDNVGGLDYNLKLSQARAEAVVKELVSKYKIAPDRLKAGGVGPLAPVSSNDTEAGRAKNRRVELVKQ